MTTNGSSIGATKARSAVDWALRILLGLAFVAAGAAKLAGAPPMIAIFDSIGIGQWFRFLTGSLELVGGFLVLLPRASAMGWHA
jgi:putative oxidoreductase